MADVWFRPVSAEARHIRGHDGVLILTDAKDDRAFIDMPNLEGARLIAAAMQNEFTASGRTRK